MYVCAAFLVHFSKEITTKKDFQVTSTLTLNADIVEKLSVVKKVILFCNVMHELFSTLPPTLIPTQVNYLVAFKGF